MGATMVLSARPMAGMEAVGNRYAVGWAGLEGGARDTLPAAADDVRGLGRVSASASVPRTAKWAGRVFVRARAGTVQGLNLRPEQVREGLTG